MRFSSRPSWRPLALGVRIKDMAKQSFGTHLREAREAVGLSQFELANLTGIPQRQISAI